MQHDLHTILASEFPAMVRDTLYARQAAGALARYDDHPEYDFSYARIWNNFVANPADLSDWQIGDLLAMPQSVLYHHCSMICTTTEREMGTGAQALETARARLIAVMAAGGQQHDIIVNGEIRSHRVEGTFHALFHNWTLRILQRNPEWGRRNPDGSLDKACPELIEPPVLDIRPITHVKIDLPTGRLLIADWIRVAGFRDIVDDESYLINHAKSRIDRTIANVRRHNLMEIACSKSFPDIVRDAAGTGLCIGHPVQDKECELAQDPDIAILGTVCTEYWACTLIDEADLARILIQAGLDGPSLIDAWRGSEYRGGITSVSLDPGTWHLYFVEPHSDNRTLHLEAASGVVNETFQTIIHLSRTVLALDPSLVLEA